MSSRELAPTRIALLELGEERATAREGYALLDEKRMLLATRILATLRQHDEQCRRWRAALERAERALAAAFDRHGVHDLEARPMGRLSQLLSTRIERLFGVRIPVVAVTPAVFEPPRPPLDESPEALRAATDFRVLLALAPLLAGVETALWRLADEYRRTERRAGAIEHLLLPELGRNIEEISAVLEAIDQEEAQRVRRAQGRSR